MQLSSVSALRMAFSDVPGADILRVRRKGGTAAAMSPALCPTAVRSATDDDPAFAERRRTGQPERAQHCDAPGSSAPAHIAASPGTPNSQVGLSMNR